MWGSICMNCEMAAREFASVLQAASVKIKRDALRTLLTTKRSVEWVTDASIEPGKLFTLLCSPKAQIDSRLRGAVLNRIRFRVGKNSIDATIRFNEDRANTRDLSHTAARPGHLSARALSCVPLDTIIVAAVLARSDLEGCAAPPGSSRLSSSP